ncbi:hypothetical protein DFH08DRAFT_825149 [Mycena albidolilacea]|uniref:Uncharacterized protein n=1 Tax=Mycena albidolilacea TaxID=1033008 RepID=A0AAD7E9K1_9AGAR|nr:hypothetical protein DFH08DRAFT_825149 [Mycena albidolilacea]
MVGMEYWAREEEMFRELELLSIYTVSNGPGHFGGSGGQWFDMLWEEIGGLMFLGGETSSLVAEMSGLAVPGRETSSLVAEMSGLAVPGRETSSLVAEMSGLAVPVEETSSLVAETSGLTVPEGETSGPIEKRGGWTLFDARSMVVDERFQYLAIAGLARAKLDAAQSAFILALFHYFVVHFGNTSAGNRNVIPWSVAVHLHTMPSRISQVLIPGKAHKPGDCTTPICGVLRKVYDLLETEGSTQRRSAAVRACAHFYEILASRKNWLLTRPIVCVAAIATCCPSSDGRSGQPSAGSTHLSGSDGCPGQPSAGTTHLSAISRQHKFKCDGCPGQPSASSRHLSSISRQHTFKRDGCPGQPSARSRHLSSISRQHTFKRTAISRQHTFKRDGCPGQPSASSRQLSSISRQHTFKRCPGQPSAGRRHSTISRQHTFKQQVGIQLNIALPVMAVRDGHQQAAHIYAAACNIHLSGMWDHSLQLNVALLVMVVRDSHQQAAHIYAAGQPSAGSRHLSVMAVRDSHQQAADI